MSDTDWLTHPWTIPPDQSRSPRPADVPPLILEAFGYGARQPLDFRLAVLEEDKSLAFMFCHG